MEGIKENEKSLRLYCKELELESSEIYRNVRGASDRIMLSKLT